jgi:cytochrome b6-f complex iron-sulfur subunit
MATAARDSAVVERAAKKEVVVEVSAPSRREFLYYIWGASLVMLLGEATAGIIWFALPRFREGEFGGTFTIDGATLPEAGGVPLSVPAGRFHVSHLEDDSLLVLYGVCTHLGCLPKWGETTDRFECPCHGSKYELDGSYIEGPAPRGLDRFMATVVFDDGSTAQSEGIDSIPLNGRTVVAVRVDTGARVNGPGR